MASPMSEPGNTILIGVIKKEQDMYFDPGVQSRRADALRELYGGNPPNWKKGPKCFPVIVIPRIVPESVLPLLPDINRTAPREFKDGAPMMDDANSLMGSFKDGGSYMDGSIKDGSFREGSIKMSGGGSTSSQRPRVQAMQQSKSDPAIRRARLTDLLAKAGGGGPPRRPKRDPMNKFCDWVEEDIKFPFKRPG